MELSHPAMAKDSFRQWKPVLFRYTASSNEAAILKKASSSKPIVKFPLSRVSLSLLGKAIGFSKKKGSPVYVQFATEEVAKQIYSELAVGLLFYFVPSLTLHEYSLLQKTILQKYLLIAFQKQQ